MTESLYDAVGGAAAVTRLAHAWHERVLADPVVSHALSHGFRDDHTERLAAYWAEQLGGPAAYTETMADHTEVVRMHSGNGVHHDMDRRAEACFAQAMDDADLPADARLREVLVAWFHWGIGEMDAYPDDPDAVPDAMPMPHWTWAGLAD